LTLRARQLERQANQSEKLISLGTLAAGLAHELRNPLVSIQTFSALLRERGHEPEFQQEFGAIMQRDVGRIASIVENVAAFAENSTVPFTPIKIEEVIAGVAEIARPELLRTGVQLQVDKKSDLPPVHGNYSQLLQVFLNLLQNAIHALEGRADGRITVAVTVRVENVRKPMLYITVADNGPGIDPALLLRVFEPFTTTKSTGDQHSRRGMGLGLAIVRRIIQYHQGAIEVTSELGKGTTFHVHLPAHAHLP
jgi:two-component system nitrogen regulation sensor histidine kinase GlnL